MNRFSSRRLFVQSNFYKLKLQGTSEKKLSYRRSDLRKFIGKRAFFFTNVRVIGSILSFKDKKRFQSECKLEPSF